MQEKSETLELISRNLFGFICTISEKREEMLVEE